MLELDTYLLVSNKIKYILNYIYFIFILFYNYFDFLYQYLKVILLISLQFILTHFFYHLKENMINILGTYIPKIMILPILFNDQYKL